MFKKIIPFILILSILFVCVLPSFAFASDASSSVCTFWDAIQMWSASALDDVPFLDTFCSTIAARNSGAICAYNNDDHLHYASDYTPLGSGEDDYGHYTLLRCKYCGDTFKCYSSDVQAAYDSSVADNYALGIGSDGGLFWYPTWDDVASATPFHGTWVGFTSSGDRKSSSISLRPLSGSCTYNGSSSVGVPTTSVSLSSRSFTFFTDFAGSSTFCFDPDAGSGNYSYIRLYPPITGYYYIVPSVFSSFNNSCYLDYSYGKKTAGNFFDVKYFSVSSLSLSGAGSFTVYLPVFKVVPTTTPTSSYTPETRTGSISLNLADESVTNVYQNVTVINEGSNTLYNPVTNNTYEINNWNYDYSTRRYSGELDVDAEADVDFEVEFGVDDLTLKIGDDEYTLKYAVESHTHTYTESITTLPTCTQIGVKTHTCTECGDAYTESIPALGHDYQLAEAEPFQYVLDTSDVLCPECDSASVTVIQDGDTSTFACFCDECNYSWTLTGSAVAGREKYVCTRCGAVTYENIGFDEDNTDMPFWKWLQQWLIRFKTWLGEKLDAISAGSSGESVSGVSVEDGVIQYEDEDGEEQEFKLKNITKKFAFVKDIYTIGKTLISVVSSDAANAYNYDFSKLDADDEETPENSAPPLLMAPNRPALNADNGIMVDGVPQLTINMGAAQSHYGFDYGGEVAFLDLSWYAPYKSTVDGLISGFLWVFFLWKLFSKAPGIISGASMDSSKADDIDRGYRRRK